MEILIAVMILLLSLFLVIIFPMAAWRIHQDLPKIINRLNTISVLMSSLIKTLNK